jgi:hypothetical protein
MSPDHALLAGVNADGMVYISPDRPGAPSSCELRLDTYFETIHLGAIHTHCVFLAGVGHADGMVNVGQHELEHLVHVNTCGVRKAKQGVVREGHLVTHGAPVEHGLVTEAREGLG